MPASAEKDGGCVFFLFPGSLRLTLGLPFGRFCMTFKSNVFLAVFCLELMTWPGSGEIFLFGICQF